MLSERVSTSCPSRLLENRPGMTGFPLRQLQKSSGIVPTKQPILYYWSSFIGSLCCSRIFTMIDTGTTFTLMHDTGKGYNVGDPQVFLGGQLHNAYTSGKGPSSKAKLPPAFLDRPAGHPLIDSCTREYRDWTKDFPAPAGSKNTPEEHFVWFSTIYQPYTHDPGSPFIPPDFTLGLPPVSDWPRRSGEPPWPLDPKDCPKPKFDLVAPADSTGASSTDESKRRRKKKKHCDSKKAELKVTTRGLGTDDPVWTNSGSAGSSSSTASSHSEGDSGLGSNLWITDTESQTRAPLRASPDP